MVLHDVRILDSITQLETGDHPVVVAASHGGRYAGYLAAKAGCRAVVFNDAGRGFEDAGTSSLAILDDTDVAAGTVDYRSARIGDGLDCLRRGTFSAVNDAAAVHGIAVGDPVLDSLERLHPQTMGSRPTVSDIEATARVLDEGPPEVWALDSLSLIDERHADAITVTGSHGERLAGERESYIGAPLAAATFFDAGTGADGAGVSRLEHLARRDVPAGAVDVATARIGDAISAWEIGHLSHINEPAATLGLEPGDDVQTFARAVRREH